jgi:hypothetical protein
LPIEQAVESGEKGDRRDWEKHDVGTRRTDPSMLAFLYKVPCESVFSSAQLETCKSGEQVLSEAAANAKAGCSETL